MLSFKFLWRVIASACRHKNILAMICALVLPAHVQSQPNIILIMTDDMREDDIALMPHIQQQLVSQGATFSNTFVTTPLCCPARVSILLGRYAHNHGILSNVGDNGGFVAFNQSGQESSTIAVSLQAAGYRTGLVGKYLNNYGVASIGIPNTYIPPGWDEWFALAGTQNYYNYSLNQNGVIVPYGSAESDYQTDVMAGLATDFIARSTSDTRPFFLHLSPTAPHTPYIVAPRHVGAFAGVQASRPPSFNEVDVSDKPLWVQAFPLMDAATEAKVDSDHQKRLEMLLAIDEMVASLVAKLGEVGVLENTYIFFTSDNGWMEGEHRQPSSKGSAYEESSGVPLLVRGPGVQANSVFDHLALNIDFAPTFLEIAGEVAAGSTMDGRSMLPLLAGIPEFEWRNKVLIEFLSTQNNSQNMPPYSAVRTAQHLYVEYTTNERELYDLWLDPYELQSQHTLAPAALQDPLIQALQNLAVCSGETCRTADAASGNTQPVAVDDIAGTVENTAIVIAVLANDSDLDGDVLTVTASSAPGNGSITLNPDGTLSYVPAPGFIGTDTLSYSIADGHGGSAGAYVTITVTTAAANVSPVAADDAASTNEDTPVTIAVLANDSDPEGQALSVTQASALNGAVAINPDGTLSYTPNANFFGVDTLSYSIADGQGGSAAAVVAVTVNAVNDPPVAVRDKATTLKNQTVTIAVLANDSDPDGDTLTVTSLTVKLGTAFVDVSGNVVYTPDTDGTGSRDIRYTLDDGHGGTAQGRVTVRVSQ